MVYAEERSGLSEYYFDFVKNTFQLLMPVDDDYPYIVDAIIMQYTGLKDKNGKEIYEGDIVDTENGIYEVLWYGEGACFRFHILGSLESPLNYDDIKVIGNIYENPELLAN